MAGKDFHACCSLSTLNVLSTATWTDWSFPPFRATFLPAISFSPIASMSLHAAPCHAQSQQPAAGQPLTGWCIGIIDPQIKAKAMGCMGVVVSLVSAIGASPSMLLSVVNNCESSSHSRHPNFVDELHHHRVSLSSPPIDNNNTSNNPVGPKTLDLMFILYWLIAT